MVGFGYSPCPGHHPLFVSAALYEQWCQDAALPGGRRMYVFGDSTVANGFKNISLPYGVDFLDGTSSGRFSNGYTIADYIAFEMQIVIPQAFNSLNNTGEECSPFEEQVTQLLGSACRIERAAVFLISIGANDYVFSYSGKDNFTDFAQILVAKLVTYLKVLHGGGTRIFLVNNLCPIGCIPDKRDKSTNKCDMKLNSAVDDFNVRLVDALKTFQDYFKVSIFLGDTNKMFAYMVDRPMQFARLQKRHASVLW